MEIGVIFSFRHEIRGKNKRHKTIQLDSIQFNCELFSLVLANLKTEFSFMKHVCKRLHAYTMCMLSLCMLRVLINYYWIEFRPYEVFVVMNWLSIRFFNQSNSGSTDFYYFLLGSFRKAKQSAQKGKHLCACFSWFKLEKKTINVLHTNYRVLSIVLPFMFFQLFSLHLLLLLLTFYFFFLFRLPSAQKFLSVLF